MEAEHNARGLARLLRLASTPDSTSKKYPSGAPGACDQVLGRGRQESGKLGGRVNLVISTMHEESKLQIGQILDSHHAGKIEAGMADSQP
jgi:hypothetical protein